MFGYVRINKPEIKFREFDVYRSYYCGLCKAIKQNYGNIARVSVTYDLTFLAMLLCGIYEPANKCKCEHCIVHPLKKHSYCENRYLDYAADMNVYLSYLKCLDDWHDDNNFVALFYSAILKRKAHSIEKKYPDKTANIKKYMDCLSALEKENCHDLDKVSGTFGNIMSEIFVLHDDVFSKALSDMGFYLGKFIYIMDAYDDLEKDKKDKNYNLLIEYEDRQDFVQFVQNVLVSMMAECCRAFEYLPIIENLEILRNILYSGVWQSFKKRNDSNKEKNNE